MTRSLRTATLATLLASLAPSADAWASKKNAPAAAPAVIDYKAPPDLDQERPEPTRVEVSTVGGDYAIHLTFPRPPWGEQCKNRCATVTLFLDTDDSPTTGLQMGKDRAETGADLAVTIQGAREYKEKSAEVFLRARVRTLDDAARSLEAGNVVAELDHRRDRDRLQSDGNEVHLLIDTADLNLPLAKTMRVVFHPPADKALEAKTRGLLGLSGGGAPQIMAGVSTKGPRRRTSRKH